MRLKMNADRIVSVSAIIVSLGTLFIILYQTNLIRKEQKASVIPYLSVGLSVATTNQSIFLVNDGLGPAFIKSIKVMYGDHEIEGDPANFLMNHHNLLGTDSIPIQTVDRIYEGRIIPEKDQITMVKIKREGVFRNFLYDYFIFNTALKESKVSDQKAVVEIAYESVYGDRWKVRSDKKIPEKMN